MIGPARRLLIGLAVLVAAKSVCAAPLSVEPPPPAGTELASSVFPYLDHYLNLPPAERSRFLPEYFVELGGKPAPQLRLYLVRGGRRTPLPLDAEGRVLVLPDLYDLKGHAAVVVSPAPKGAFVAHLEMRALVPEAKQMDAGEVALAIAQVDHAVHGSAGLISFAVPHFNQAVFEGAVAGRAVLADGRQIALPVHRRGPAFEPSRLKSVRSLTFERPPSRVYVVTGP